MLQSSIVLGSSLTSWKSPGAIWIFLLRASGPPPVIPEDWKFLMEEQIERLHDITALVVADSSTNEAATENST